MGEVESEGQRLANEWADECLTADAALAIDAALRRAKAEGVLMWTKKQPTEAGWYWFRKDENHCMEPIHVRIGIRELECKWGYIDMQSGEWAVPIASPLDARAAQIETER